METPAATRLDYISHISLSGGFMKHTNREQNIGSSEPEFYSNQSNNANDASHRPNILQDFTPAYITEIPSLSINNQPMNALQLLQPISTGASSSRPLSQSSGYSLTYSEPSQAQYLEQQHTTSIQNHSPLEQFPSFDNQNGKICQPPFTMDKTTENSINSNSSSSVMLNEARFYNYANFKYSPSSALLVPSQVSRSPSIIEDGAIGAQHHFHDQSVISRSKSENELFNSKVKQEEQTTNEFTDQQIQNLLSSAKTSSSSTGKRRPRTKQSYHIEKPGEQQVSLNDSFSCEVCGKVFAKSYNLKSHLKTHSDEKPFHCTFCQRSFARNHDRKRHELLHQGVKKFQCGGFLKDKKTRWGCGKRFSRADGLGRHFRTDIGWLCIRPLMMEAKQSESSSNAVSLNHDNGNDNSLHVHENPFSNYVGSNQNLQDSEGFNSSNLDNNLINEILKRADQH